MTDDPAKSRFMALQLIRLTGAVLSIFGLAVLAGRFDLPRVVGIVLFLVGMFDLLALPLILAKRWKSPQQ